MSEMPKELSKLIEAGDFNPSQVQMTESGQNVMRADVMQFLMTASIASQAVKIRKYFDDRKSQGWILSFDNVIASPVVPSEEFKLDSPAQSISITNNALAGGPVIWVEINRRFNSRRTLNPLETLEVNFETHKLKCFFVQCPPGVPPIFSATIKG